MICGIIQLRLEFLEDIFHLTCQNASKKARWSDLAFYVDYLKFLSNFNNAINNVKKIIASTEDINFTPFRVIMLNNYIIIKDFSKYFFN